MSTEPGQVRARSSSPEAERMRLREVVEGTAKLYGAKVKLVYKRNYPVTKNHAQRPRSPPRSPRRWSAANGSMPRWRRFMVAEDFSFKTALPYEKPRLQAVKLANQGAEPLKMRSELET